MTLHASVAAEAYPTEAARSGSRHAGPWQAARLTQPGPASRKGTPTGHAGPGLAGPAGLFPLPYPNALQVFLPYLVHLYKFAPSAACQPRLT